MSNHVEAETGPLYGQLLRAHFLTQPYHKEGKTVYVFFFLLFLEGTEDERTLLK